MSFCNLIVFLLSHPREVASPCSILCHTLHHPIYHQEGRHISENPLRPFFLTQTSDLCFSPTSTTLPHFQTAQTWIFLYSRVLNLRNVKPYQTFLLQRRPLQVQTVPIFLVKRHRFLPLLHSFTIPVSVYLRHTTIQPGT